MLASRRPAQHDRRDHHVAADLRDQLDEVRASRLAVEQDEAVLGESSLASPVFDSYGEVVGAIGVVVPSTGDG